MCPIWNKRLDYLLSRQLQDIRLHEIQNSLTLTPQTVIFGVKIRGNFKTKNYFELKIHIFCFRTQNVGSVVIAMSIPCLFVCFRKAKQVAKIYMNLQNVLSSPSLHFSLEKGFGQKISSISIPK